MSIILKIVEALITFKFSANSLSDNQHGFRSKHFIVTNNLIFQIDILTSINESQ